MRDIDFFTSISGFSVQNLLGKLDCPGEQRVWINSPGGTFEFFSVLAPPLIRKGFTAIALEVASSANVLYLLANNRYAVPDATFYFHEVLMVGCRGVITICSAEEAVERARETAGRNLEEAMETLRRLRTGQDYFLDMVSSRTGLQKSVFLSLMRGDITLTAKEAVRYGIVREIISREQLLGR